MVQQALDAPSAFLVKERSIGFRAPRWGAWESWGVHIVASDSIQGKKILVIDDDPTVRAVLSQSFELNGCEIMEAEQGRQGLNKARENPVDLIILDVVLPDMDGYSICRELKSDDITKDIPVIFLSAKAESKERVKGLRLGAVDYITKPFDLDEVLARTDIALRIKSDRDQEAPGVADEEAAIRVLPEAAESGPMEDQFIPLIEKRFEALDPQHGLLTLAFIRADQEDLLLSKGHEELRDAIVRAIVQILEELSPDGTEIGRIDPIQLGVLFPRKNKYGAELILDELSSRLELMDFGSLGQDHRITLSCGVAEYPNTQIESAKQFEETAEFALRRALRTGGDQTVLL